MYISVPFLLHQCCMQTRAFCYVTVYHGTGDAVNFNYGARINAHLAPTLYRVCVCVCMYTHTRVYSGTQVSSTYAVYV